MRLKIKKKLFDKNDLTTHSKEVYLIEEIKRNKYKLNNNEWYKEYEITPANTVEFVPDNEFPEVEKQINEIIKFAIWWIGLGIASSIGLGFF